MTSCSAAAPRTAARSSSTQERRQPSRAATYASGLAAGGDFIIELAYSVRAPLRTLRDGCARNPQPLARSLTCPWNTEGQALAHPDYRMTQCGRAAMSNVQ